MKEKKQCLSLTLSAYEFSLSMLIASEIHDEDNVVVVMLYNAYMCQAVVKYDVVKVYVRGIFGDIKSVQNLHLNQQVVPCFNSVFPHNIAGNGFKIVKTSAKEMDLVLVQLKLELGDKKNLGEK